MLLTNSLFLDSEYKADCEYKINYLSLMELNNITNDTTDLRDTFTKTTDSKCDPDKTYYIKKENQYEKFLGESFENRY